MTSQSVHGRGAADNPDNRFVRLTVEPDPECSQEERAIVTEYFVDASKTILSRNDSPDIGFEFSVNPYRGCEHGCIYCYARPTHEYLGLSAGLEFESKIFVKEKAPELLRAELMNERWRPQAINFSGVTDCYQPLERRLRLTRRCLEVLIEFKNPAAVITKSALIERDIDVLAELAAIGGALVGITITTLDESLASKLEPRAASPRRRIGAIAALANAGVPVHVMTAPIVPGLTDHEIPAILKAAAEAGARSAGWTLLRLPHAVNPLFEDWLTRYAPGQKEKVLRRIEDARGGERHDSRFHVRMRGEGRIAEEVADMFAFARDRAGLAPDAPKLSATHFRRPGPQQGKLF